MVISGTRIRLIDGIDGKIFLSVEATSDDNSLDESDDITIGSYNEHGWDYNEDGAEILDSFGIDPHSFKTIGHIDALTARYLDPSPCPYL